jgi:hypothetical protein
VPSAKQVKIHWQAVRWIHKYIRTNAGEAEGNAQEHLYSVVKPIAHNAFECESSDL